MKKYLKALYDTRKIFSGKYKKLFFWLTVRGGSLCVAPLIFPLSITFLFDAIQSGISKKIFETSVIIIALIVPIYMLSFFICYYSDSFVVGNVYEWQKKILTNYSELDYLNISHKYEIGELTGYISASAWAGVQAWIHLFRIVAPIISAIILSFFLVKNTIYLLLIVLCCWFFDLLISKYKLKIIAIIEERIEKKKNIKDSTLKELTTNIHLHLINNSYDLILNKYGIDREIYWRQKEGELHINLCFSAINLFLEKIYYILIVYILIYANMSGNLSNGSISAAYTNFEKLRSQFIDMKKQVETTVKKATPILLQKNIFEKNIKEVKFVENDCDKIMVENLSFKVEDQYILKDISLLLPLGKKIALIGENGSGKTSLLRCIAGINTSYTGNVKLLNEKYDLSSNKNKIMYATAQPKIFLDSSTYENIMMACESDPVSYVYGDVLDLKKYDEKEVECLSGGEKQRINLIT